MNFLDWCHIETGVVQVNSRMRLLRLGSHGPVSPVFSIIPVLVHLSWVTNVFCKTHRLLVVFLAFISCTGQ